MGWIKTISSAVVGWKTYLIVGTLAVSIAASGLFYIHSLQSQRDLAVQRAEIYKDANNENLATIKHLRDAADSMTAVTAIITKKWTAADEQVNALEDRIRSANLNAEAVKNPRAVEDKINGMMKQALRCNEIVTGSPVTAADAANAVCPEIVKRGR
jgi:uncharacterized phage infection (PIP) family protein YhgE